MSQPKWWKAVEGAFRKLRGKRRRNRKSPQLHRAADAPARVSAPQVPAALPPPAEAPATLTIADALRHRFPALLAPTVYDHRESGRYVVVITDSLGAGSLFGGVGTALVLAALLATRLRADLRIVTRGPHTSNIGFDSVLAAHNITFDGKVDFVHAPAGENRSFPLGERDLVLTTSWWTTKAVLGIVPLERILYLLQEDERMFYPFGDDRVMCAQTLATPGLKRVINSNLLYRHLTDTRSGPPAIGDALWFEPAFPAYPRRPRKPMGTKGRFFFYARPLHARNLYWRGLEVIEHAILQGVLDPETWDIYFVGSQLSKVELPGGAVPILVQDLSWKDYAALIATMDVGLSLMDTPHPSYPPLDLSASGAVVVTNQHGLKTDLLHYSRNIICADVSVEGLTAGIASAIALARDSKQRMENLESDTINRDWHVALAPILDAFGG